MQYEFSAESNRVFVKTRLALVSVAVLAIIQIVLTIAFHLHQISALSHFGSLRLIGNTIMVVALVVLLVQALAASNSLRTVVQTSGNDLVLLLSSLNSSRNALASIVILLMVDFFFALARHSSLVACMKLA